MTDNQEIPSKVTLNKHRNFLEFLEVFKLPMILLVTFASLALILVVVGLILFLVDIKLGGKVVLIIAAIISLIGLVASILPLFINKNKIEYTRIRYIGTTKTITTVRKYDDNSMNYKKFIFTHHYEKIFTTEDGKDIKIEFTKKGGYVTRFYDGHNIDGRIMPIFNKLEDANE